MNNKANNGYYGYSMSERAREAYSQGERPISKWTKADILTAAGKVEGIKPEILARLKKLNKEELIEICLHKTSWHHTSMHFNKTSFYGIAEYELSGMTEECLEEKLRNFHFFKKEMPKEPTERYVSAGYTEWSGSRRHPKSETKYCMGIIRGNWFYSYDGNVKKKADGNHFFITKEYPTKEAYETAIAEDMKQKQKEKESEKRRMMETVKESQKKIYMECAFLMQTKYKRYSSFIKSEDTVTAATALLNECLTQRQGELAEAWEHNPHAQDKYELVKKPLDHISEQDHRFYETYFLDYVKKQYKSGRSYTSAGWGTELIEPSVPAKGVIG